MTREELIEKLDSLCWSARRYGHDDHGIYGFGVTITGEDAEEGWDGEIYHPEAVALADELVKILFRPQPVDDGFVADL